MKQDVEVIADASLSQCVLPRIHVCSNIVTDEVGYENKQRPLAMPLDGLKERQDIRQAISGLTNRRSRRFGRLPTTRVFHHLVVDLVLSDGVSDLHWLH
jgi:hypothetical protein